MGKFAPYKVHLAALPDGKHEQDFECGTEFFKNMENPDVIAPDIISSDVKVHLDLVKKNDVYDCVFTCKGMLKVPCDRCLDPIDHEVDTIYHIIVKYGEDYNDETDDLLVIPYSDNYLNVAYMLYDTIILTIPLRRVHPMGKCNRAMLAALHKHRNSGDAEVDEAMDEVDSEFENGGGNDSED